MAQHEMMGEDSTSQDSDDHAQESYLLAHLPVYIPVSLYQFHQALEASLDKANE